MSRDQKRIGIVGATGFIGSFLLRELLSKHTGDVRALLRSPSRTSDDHCEVVVGDLCDSDDCRRFAQGLHTIYYLAHRNTPSNSDLDIPNDARLNLVPLLNLLQVIERIGTKPHIVYFSSRCTYGMGEKQARHNENDACIPVSSYGVQKLAAELYLRIAAESGYLSAVVLRVANAYGGLLACSRSPGLIGAAVNSALGGTPFRILGRLSNIREFVHIQDICAMAQLAGEVSNSYSIFNVGSGVGYTVEEVLSTISATVKRPIELIQCPGVGENVDAPVLDIAKAQRELGWAPQVSLTEGIRMIAEANSANGKSYSRVATLKHPEGVVGSFATPGYSIKVLVKS